MNETKPKTHDELKMELLCTKKLIYTNQIEIIRTKVILDELDLRNMSSIIVDMDQLIQELIDTGTKLFEVKTKEIETPVQQTTTNEVN